MPEFGPFPRFDDPEALTPTTVGGSRVFADVQYAIVPGYRPLLLDLWVPVGAAKHPVVVSIHGGGWLMGSHKYLATDIVPFDELRDELLKRGVAVASVQYRHSAEAPFPAQLHDVRAAARWLRHSAAAVGIDPDRFGVVGESAGAHLALLLSTNAEVTEFDGDIGVEAAGESSTVSAAVAWYAPTRLDTMQAETSAGSPFEHDAPDSSESLLIGRPLTENRDRARWASPISHVSERTAPTLLIHGRDDLVVPHQQSVAYHDALVAAGVPATLTLVDGADHCFIGVDSAPLVLQTADFLAKALHAGGAD